MKIPIFSNYDKTIRQLQSDDSYEEFLKEIMRIELLQRQDNLHKRRIKSAKFPIHKTIDKFDLNRLENVWKAYITELVEAFQGGRLSKLEKSLSKVDLLIIDKLSYLTFNRHQSELLLQVISERSECGSVIITTNLEFSKWTELFENEMTVSVLLITSLFVRIY